MRAGDFELQELTVDARCLTCGAGVSVRTGFILADGDRFITDIRTRELFCQCTRGAAKELRIQALVTVDPERSPPVKFVAIVAKPAEVKP